MDKYQSFIWALVGCSIIIMINSIITTHHEMAHSKIAELHGCEVVKQTSGILSGYTMWECEEYTKEYGQAQKELDSDEVYTVTNLLRFLLSVIILTIFVFWI